MSAIRHNDGDETTTPHQGSSTTLGTCLAGSVSECNDIKLNEDYHDNISDSEENLEDGGVPFNIQPCLYDPLKDKNTPVQVDPHRQIILNALSEVKLAYDQIEIERKTITDITDRMNDDDDYDYTEEERIIHNRRVDDFNSRSEMIKAVYIRKIDELKLFDQSQTAPIFIPDIKNKFILPIVALRIEELSVLYFIGYLVYFLLLLFFSRSMISNIIVFFPLTPLITGKTSRHLFTKRNR